MAVYCSTLLTMLKTWETSLPNRGLGGKEKRGQWRALGADGWLYMLPACREGEGAETESFSRGKDLLQPCFCTSGAGQWLLVADQRVSSKGTARKFGGKVLWRAGASRSGHEFLPVPANSCCPCPTGPEWW